MPRGKQSNLSEIAERKYLVEAEKIIYEDYGDNNRKTHNISRQALNELQKKLGISPERAIAIENEVLQTCLNYDEKLQIYKQTLVDTLQGEDIIDDKTRKKLKHLQDALGLEDETVAVAYSRFGNELSSQDELQKAISVFQEAIRISPDSAEAYLGLGVLYKQGNQKEAIKNLTVAKGLFENQKKIEKAQQIEQSLLKQRNNNNVFKILAKWLLH